MITEGVIDFDRVKCPDFDYKKHFDKEKLFSFLDKAKITYKRKKCYVVAGKFKSCKKRGFKSGF